MCSTIPLLLGHPDTKAAADVQMIAVESEMASWMQKTYPAIIEKCTSNREQRKKKLPMILRDHRIDSN